MFVLLVANWLSCINKFDLSDLNTTYTRKTAKIKALVLYTININYNEMDAGRQLSTCIHCLQNAATSYILLSSTIPEHILWREYLDVILLH